MSWRTLATGLFASFPTDLEGSVRVVSGVQEIVALMREPDSGQSVIITNVAGGSAVSTIIRRARAIISTIGGPNSHIVIVARDYNVPCIVGAKNPELLAVRNGTQLRLSKDGTIQIWEAGSP
jgi:phosphoenolpyruvate-protein kinase (PTS system EI component)